MDLFEATLKRLESRYRHNEVTVPRSLQSKHGSIFETVLTPIEIEFSDCPSQLYCQVFTGESAFAYGRNILKHLNFLDIPGVSRIVKFEIVDALIWPVVFYDLQLSPQSASLAKVGSFAQFIFDGRATAASLLHIGQELLRALQMCHRTMQVMNAFSGDTIIIVESAQTLPRPMFHIFTRRPEKVNPFNSRANLALSRTYTNSTEVHKKYVKREVEFVQKVVDNLWNLAAILLESCIQLKFSLQEFTLCEHVADIKSHFQLFVATQRPLNNKHTTSYKAFLSSEGRRMLNNDFYDTAMDEMITKLLHSFNMAQTFIMGNKLAIAIISQDLKLPDEKSRELSVAKIAPMFSRAVQQLQPNTSITVPYPFNGASVFWDTECKHILKLVKNVFIRISHLTTWEECCLLILWLHEVPLSMWRSICNSELPRDLKSVSRLLGQILKKDSAILNVALTVIYQDIQDKVPPVSKKGGFCEAMLACLEL